MQLVHYWQDTFVNEIAFPIVQVDHVQRMYAVSCVELVYGMNMDGRYDEFVYRFYVVDFRSMYESLHIIKYINLIKFIPLD